VLIDPLTGAATVVVGSRQARPNLPADACPFCVGGIESPEPYEVRAFVNRFPAMPDDRCEVVLYTSRHDATFASLGVEGARRVVDLWADRSAALGARDDVAYVLVFENRGAEVGATIAHPHGQIYAFDLVPPAPAHEGDLFADRAPPGADRHVASSGEWTAWAARASSWPIDLRLAPESREPDLPSLTKPRRTELAALLVDVLARLDRLYDRPLPYMLWFHQRPFDGREWDGPPLHAHLVSPWRDAHVARYIAAGELGSEVFFNPVAPEACAAALRAASG
jgi:UDPglucose--hexose-1-phosphate uridylyltransferase